MKKIILTLLFSVLLFGVNHSMAQKKESKRVYFRSSMDCADCEKTITDYVRFEKGVREISCDHISNTVKIIYTEGKNSDEGLAKAIVKKGYKAEKITEEEYKAIVESAKENPGKQSGNDHK